MSGGWPWTDDYGDRIEPVMHPDGPCVLAQIDGWLDPELAETIAHKLVQAADEARRLGGSS